MKNVKERTQLFEQISGSNVYKEDYESMKNEMTKAEQETQFSYHRKKGTCCELERVHTLFFLSKSFLTASINMNCDYRL